MTVTFSGMTGIMTTYHGAISCSRGPRITADAGLGRRISVPYRFALSSDDNHAAAAQALCDKFKWTGDLRAGGHDRVMFFVFMEK